MPESEVPIPGSPKAARRRDKLSSTWGRTIGWTPSICGMNLPGTQRVTAIRLETSLSAASGFSFTSLGSGNLDANPAGTFSQSDPISANEFAFDAVQARYVRMTIVQNGGSPTVVGLREVAFNQANAIPEPGSMILLPLTGALFAFRNTKRKA